jgi:broad specificity phosphatase PhoE
MRPRITFVCQGTTRALRTVTFGADEPLDDIGREKAQRLTGSLGHVDRCWTSPALAARETADALGLDAAVDERLRDCDYGRWNGRQFKQILLREPRKLVSWIRNPSTAPHGGEAIPSVLERVADWLRERGTNDGHTVAVSNAAVIRAAIVHVIEAQLPSFWKIDVLPLSMADFRTNGRRWVLRAITPLTASEAAE